MAGTYEQIVEDVLQALRGLSWPGEVRRVLDGQEPGPARPAQSRLPTVTVAPELPRVLLSRRADPPEFLSELACRIEVAAMVEDRGAPRVDDMAADVWRTLLADPGRGGLALDTLCELGPAAGWAAPYAAFTVTARIRYAHGADEL
jgi:hypothetical protein